MGERTARFTNLDPGKYRFEVMAANHQGVWSALPIKFDFYLKPHLWQTPAFYLLCAVGVAALAAGIQNYRLRWQHRLLKFEEQRTVANERTRIARDLHDDLGTALTGLALELDLIGRERKDVTPFRLRLAETARRTRDLAERMREVVWTVNPKCDTLSSLASFLEQQVEQFLNPDGIRVRLEFPEDIPALPLAAQVRHQLALSIREALTNVVRHSGATEVLVSLAIKDQTLELQVNDNGKGFQPVEYPGRGLANIRSRIEQLGGVFDCISTPGTGTLIRLRLPFPK
jgi:signal transduction histidine kinase